MKAPKWKILSKNIITIIVNLKYIMNMKRLLSMIILLTITLSGLYAQAWMSQAVNIGEKHTDFDYSDTKDLRGSLSGQHPDIPGKHVIYKVRLLKSGSLFISTCNSYFLQTRVRILNTNCLLYTSDAADE